jgi:phage-related protein
LIFISHGIIKKSQKTPSKGIYKAVKIRMEYLNQKDEKDN